MPVLLQSIQNLLIYAASFVVVLSVVVFVHEYGHFQVARWRKVAIDTFSIGFGKTLLGWRDRHGVHWKIGALPLGGYVKFADDADAMSTGPRERIDDPVAMAEARRRGLFHAQPLNTRAMVVAAGPLTNFIFAILGFALLAYIVGRDTTDINTIPARISQVAENSAASRAGIHPGDIIVAVDGAAVHSFPDLQSHITGAANRQVTLDVQRGSGALRLLATPTPRGEGPPAQRGQGMLGVTGPLILDSEHSIQHYNPIEALGRGAVDTWSIIAQTGSYIGAVFTGHASGNQIAGPLGIINVSGQVATSALNPPGGGDWPSRLATLGLALLNLAAVLSVAVGFVNLLPIPILDGGHLLFYIIEAARGGKPLPPAAQEWAYRAGFAVMASLFLFATWNDITRLLPGAH